MSFENILTNAFMLRVFSHPMLGKVGLANARVPRSCEAMFTVLGPEPISDSVCHIPSRVNEISVGKLMQ